MTLKNTPFPTYYEEFIFKSRYARWIEAEKRRENWDETVTRLVDYYSDQINDGEKGRRRLSSGEEEQLYDAIYNLEVMPSMRAMMSAGPSLSRCNVSAYNCAYLTVNSPRAFDECMYILMNGTGVGYSVEEKYTHQLPVVAEEFEETDTLIKVADSKEGWARAFRELISLLYVGQIPSWDVSLVRPAGARLKTFGGRASGPEPLVNLFRFTVNLFKNAQGRRLTTIECHDLMCMVADVVVCGGVRRSAMISLSDLTDDRMRVAKSGAWWDKTVYRALANNSAVYENRRPDMEVFMKEWKSLYDSKSGERGIFSRYACQQIAARSGRRNPEFAFGTNPCSEIILRPFQFCNLTEVIVRGTDTLETLKRKVVVATILGTIQSTFTDFKYLRKIWKDNCDEERLLGVSFTGVCDNFDILNNKDNLNELRQVAIDTNKEWAGRLGINPSASITCVKPSGTVSQLVNSSSGLHPRHSPYYIRTVRADQKDPVTDFLKSQGVPWEVDVTNANNCVFSFPIASPRASLDRNRQSAIEALEFWKLMQNEWCEHKPSITVNVKEDEWLEVGAWVYKNFDVMSGVSFLPYDGGSYAQAPYQECTEEVYNELLVRMPDSIDWDTLSTFEDSDNTSGSQELACSGNVCEVVSIGNVHDG